MRTTLEMRIWDGRRFFSLCVVVFLRIFVLSDVMMAQEWYTSKVLIGEARVEVGDKELLEGILDEKNVTRSREGEMYAAAIEEARTIARFSISAHIHGFIFEYHPVDKARGTREIWKIIPLASIDQNDVRLSMLKTRKEGNIFFFLYRYNLDEMQIEKLKAWKSARIDPATGIGSALAENGSAATQIEALENAIQSGVRSRLRKRISAKPRVVKGIVRIATLPSIMKVEGYYRTKIPISLQTDSIDAFTFF